MTTLFKAGDKILCVNNESTLGLGSIKALKLNEVYTVNTANSEFVYLNGVEGGWNHDRFVKVEDAPVIQEAPINLGPKTMKVRVFVSGTPNDWAVGGRGDLVTDAYAEDAQLADYGHEVGYWLNLEVPVPQRYEYTMVGYEFRQTSSDNN